MPIVPVRDIGTLGVITDVDPLNLPINAFSAGVNCRFDNKSVVRGPVFRKAGTLSNKFPRHFTSYRSSFDVENTNLVCSKDGRVSMWNTTGLFSTNETDLTPKDWLVSDSELSYTSCELQNIVYINREDRTPWFRSKGASTFTTFANLSVWPSTWRTRVLRSYAGVLVGLNVTKSGINRPTDLVWSDFCLFDNTPGTFIADTTNSAGGTTLGDMKEPIIDGLGLRDRFIIYGAQECWTMDYIGGNDVFAFRKLFPNWGIVSTNAVVEHNNTHFVFGPHDIWMHDGVQPRSIASGRVRNFIYRYIVMDRKNDFFVVHNPRISEVLFCYVSNDPLCGFPNNGTAGCNRAASYNYEQNYWTFYDLPYLTHAGIGEGHASMTYAEAQNIDYSTVGTFYGSGNGRTSLFTLSSEFGPITPSVRAFELFNTDNTGFPLDDTVLRPVILEKASIDLDEVGAELRGYKVLSTIYPEGSMTKGSNPLVFTLGAADYNNSNLTFSADQTFDGLENYKLDFNSAGRYLFVRVKYDDYRDFSLVGLDMDLKITGKR